MGNISENVPIIRAMNHSDIDRIVEIDTKVLGNSRPEYWEFKVEMVEKGSPMSSLVAEIDGRVVGFVIGDASGWEYGVPENIGWIDTIGMDPEYQKKGPEEKYGHGSQIVVQMKCFAAEKIEKGLHESPVWPHRSGVSCILNRRIFFHFVL